MKKFFAAMAMALAVAVMLMLHDATAAQAAAISLKTHTSLRHYVVSGADELSLLREMRRKGPRVGGKPALASTRMRARYAAVMRRQGGVCKVRSFRIRTQYTIMLPRLSGTGPTPKSVRKGWDAFLGKLRRHERHHISIWSACLQQVRRRLPRMQAGDCTTLKRRMHASYERIMAQCGKRHDAFDRKEQHAAARLPFIRAAFRRAAKRASAARRDVIERRSNVRHRGQGRARALRQNWQ